MRTAAALLITTLSLASCHSATGVSRDLPNGVPPLRSFELPDNVVATAFSLPALSLPRQTSVGLRLTNPGSIPATVEHGACSVAVWLYRPETAGRGPAWQGLLEQTVCIAILYRHMIEPRASYDVSGALLGANTLGDSLPAGAYLARVAIRRRSMPSREGQLVVLDAGTVILP